MIKFNDVEDKYKEIPSIKFKLKNYINQIETISRINKNDIDRGIQAYLRDNFVDKKVE